MRFRRVSGILGENLIYREAAMEFLYTSKEIAVILKPVGLDAEQEVPAAIAAEIGGDVFPVHRLDKNVGGCMVYARTPRAAAALSRAVQEMLGSRFYRRSVREDVGDSDTLPGLDRLKLTDYDTLWASRNRGDILQKWAEAVKEGAA